MSTISLIYSEWAFDDKENSAFFFPNKSHAEFQSIHWNLLNVSFSENGKIVITSYSYQMPLFNSQI